MPLTARTRKNIKTVAAITLAGILIGPLFANLVYGYTFYRVVKGVAIGFLITSASSAAEVFVFQQKLKRLSFSNTLLIRTIFYILVISVSTIIVVLIHESTEDGTDLMATLTGKDMQEFFRSDFVSILIFAVITSFSINFFWQLNRMLGKGVLINLLLGKYSSPKAEKRIFMFLDLKSSTSHAEKLGTFKYSSLIQDLFYDVTESIIETKGEVYQYIGDEIVLTWKIKKGLIDNNAVECFFKIKKIILDNNTRYYEKYGINPSFKAGAHLGEAIVTEVGDIKKEIVYHGDVLNTTSRIQEQCKILAKDFLISGDLLKKLELNNKYKIENMGSFMLRGKEKEVNLFSLVANNISSHHETFSQKKINL